MELYIHALIIVVRYIDLHDLKQLHRFFFYLKIHSLVIAHVMRILRNWFQICTLTHNWVIYAWINNK
jgi:hypothetical protein